MAANAGCTAVRIQAATAIDGDPKRPATMSAAMRAHSVEDYSITAVLRLLRHVIAHEQG